MARPKPPLKRDGSFRFKRVGVPLRRFNDVFHFLMRVNIWLLLALVFGVYALTNLLFALLYLLDPGGIEGMRPNLFQALWFSVQTMATIGYGTMSPTSFYTNAVVFVEAFVGLAGVAIATGLLFARLSRPTAMVAFSEALVVHRRDGVPTLMLRMANERSNQVVEARMTLSVLLDEVTSEGDRLRRLRTLELERDVSPLFTLSWTAFHPIDERSPLHGLPDGPVDERVRGYIVTFQGLDDTFSQTIHARKIYLPSQVSVGTRFVDMLTDLPDGRVQIDHSLLSEVQPCALEEARDLPGDGVRWRRMADAAEAREEVERASANEVDDHEKDGDEEGEAAK